MIDMELRGCWDVGCRMSDAGCWILMKDIKRGSEIYREEGRFCQSLFFVPFTLEQLKYPKLHENSKIPRNESYAGLFHMDPNNRSTGWKKIKF